jgi:hypothetical protein
VTTTDETRSRRCPYCGCGFEPAEPGQLYCSPFCEYEDVKKQTGG